MLFDAHTGMASPDNAAGSAEVEYTDADIIRILVSTDNHLGFLERDPIRGADSFLAFEELLEHARDSKVDLVLLAGDLFHENKPSRYTLYKTLEILRKYVMGYNPVRIQVVSDQSIHFKDKLFNRVNWEDPHYNVDLPIFSIHGNHDDPTRETDETLAALDLLAVANLINYFGKAESADHITLNPLMLVKNKSKVCLYGLGNLRDDRFQRMVINNAIKFKRPAHNAEQWFNIFLIHQNRDNRALRSKTGNNTAEQCLPKFLDLVIWGHEHECFPEVSRASGAGQTFVLQPGSTVATSLSDGESRTKHVFMLEVRGSQFRTTPMQLKKVRPFFLREISLASNAKIHPDAPDVDIRVKEFLQAQVAAVVDEAKQALLRMPEEQRPPLSLQRPLIRLKVDHTGFSVLSNQRFGSIFSEIVANPGDILLFTKRAAQRERAPKEAKVVAPSLPSDAPALRVEDLVVEQLKSAQLALLEDDALNFSLKKYVDGDTRAIRDFVDDTLRARQDAAQKSKATTREMLVEVLKKERASKDTGIEDAALQRRTEELDREAVAEQRAFELPAPNTSRARGKMPSNDDSDSANELMNDDGRTARPAKSAQYDEDDDEYDRDDDDERFDSDDLAASAKSKTRGRGRGRGTARGASSASRGRGRKTAAPESTVPRSSSPNLGSEEEPAVSTATGRGRGRGATSRSRGTAKTSTSRTSAATSAGQKRGRTAAGMVTLKQDNDDDDDVEFVEAVPTALPVPSSQAPAAKRRLPWEK